MSQQCGLSPSPQAAELTLATKSTRTAGPPADEWLRGGAVVNAACWRRDLVRRARAQVEHRIAAGELTAAEIILGSRWEIESMQIGGCSSAGTIVAPSLSTGLAGCTWRICATCSATGASHWHEPPTSHDIGAIRSETPGPRSCRIGTTS